jgi:hypothetical protein
MKRLHIFEEPIKFEDEVNEKAHKAWLKAMKIGGDHVMVSQLLNINWSRVSAITNGQPIKGEDHRKQIFPTPEQAIKVSLLTGCKVTAEQLLPNYDFRYLYKYVKTRKKK